MLAPVRHARVLVLVVLLAVLPSASCGGSSTTEPTRDWIELRSIQPAEGTTFAPNQQVTFTASVDCTVASSDGGTVALIVQAPSVINQPAPVTLSKGTRTVTLTSTVTMPATETALSVFIPLWVNGSTTTSMMKQLSYTVR